MCMWAFFRDGCHVVTDNSVRRFIIITEVRAKGNAAMPAPTRITTDLTEAAKEKQNNNKLSGSSCTFIAFIYDCWAHRQNDYSLFSGSSVCYDC